MVCITCVVLVCKCWCVYQKVQVRRQLRSLRLGHSSRAPARCFCHELVSRSLRWEFRPPWSSLRGTRVTALRALVSPRRLHASALPDSTARSVAALSPRCVHLQFHVYVAVVVRNRSIASWTGMRAKWRLSLRMLKGTDCRVPNRVDDLAASVPRRPRHSSFLSASRNKLVLLCFKSIGLLLTTYTVLGQSSF